MTDSHSIAMEAKTNNRRFSVLHLIVGTAIAAVYCAALFNETPWWRATLGTITLAMLLNSALAAIYATGLRRVFAVGFLIGAIFLCVGSLQLDRGSLPPFSVDDKALGVASSSIHSNSRENYLLSLPFLDAGYLFGLWICGHLVHKSHRH